MSELYQCFHLEFTEVSGTKPCAHCNKPDWCYTLGDDLSVCKRDYTPAFGWYKTDRKDKEGSFYYAKEQKKKTRKPARQTWEYPDRNGNKFVQVVRVTPGKLLADGSRKEKDIFQQKWNGDRWVNGTKGIKRYEIPIYRYQEVRAAINKNIPIVIVEGETCADALWELEIPATTNIGGGGKWRDSDTKDLEGAKIIIAPDRDVPGVNYALKIAENFPDAQWIYAPPSSFFWQSKHLEKSKGLDIADYINDYKPSRETILNLIIPDSPTELNKNLRELYPKKSQKDDTPSLELELKNKLDVELPVTLKAQDALFSDGDYIAIDDKLYKWDETHYKACNQAHERRRITEWCKATPVNISKERYQYKYAKASVVEDIWKWVLLDFGVDRSKVNPPGLNCLNGTLKIEFLGKKVITTLHPHSKDYYYTYCSQITYDPDALDHDCNRMLAALDPEAQTIFLRTMAASLDLGYVRSVLGRGVKALLCQGTGSNGKDTLRQAMSILLSRGMTNASVADFKQYDSGRKFPLAKLEGARINWASENSNFTCIDNLQSLKMAITGDTIDIEPKNAIEFTYDPVAVFLFNVNEAPLLSGGMDAIKDRYAVMSFNKTYKKGANLEAGELEADPRFRYDANFLQENVCPALLNKIIEQLPLLLKEGIDYSSCEESMKTWQRETNHLWDFAHEKGLEYSPGSKVYLSDLWEELKDWYIENEMIHVFEHYSGEKSLQFGEAPRKGDNLIKASNQLFKRFSALFPKTDRGQESGRHPRKKAKYLLNLKFHNEEIDFRNGTRAIQEEILRERKEKQKSLNEDKITMLIETLSLEEIQIFQSKFAKLGSQGSHPDTVRVDRVPVGFPQGSQQGSPRVPTPEKQLNVDSNQDSSITNNTTSIPSAMNVNVSYVQNDLNITEPSVNTTENQVSTLCKNPSKKLPVRVQLRSGEFAQVLEQEGNQVTVRLEGKKTMIKVNLEECQKVYLEAPKTGNIKGV